MSNVLEFRPASAGGPVSSLAPKATAEIVIFPGIRYEKRNEEAGAHSSKPSRGGGSGSRRRGSKSGRKN